MTRNERRKIEEGLKKDIRKCFDEYEKTVIVSPEDLELESYMREDRKKRMKNFNDAYEKRGMANYEILGIEYLWDCCGLELDATIFVELFGEKGVNDIDSMRYGVSEIKNFLVEKYGLKGGDLLFVCHDLIARCKDDEKCADPENVEWVKDHVDNLKTFLRIFIPIVKEEVNVSN